MFLHDMNIYKELVIWLRGAPAFNGSDQNIAEESRSRNFFLRISKLRGRIAVSSFMYSSWCVALTP